METKGQLSELHSEHNEWQNQIKFYRDELKEFNKQLNDIVTQSAPNEVLVSVEHFQNQFINFLETIFNPVQKIKNDSFRTERLGDKYFQRRWDVDEIAILIDVNTTLERACELLERKFMSVNIKRGEFIPD